VWTHHSSSTRLSGALFFRITGSQDDDDPGGVLKSSTESKTFHPIFVKIRCNNIPQEALIDTGSAVTIIHKSLLNKIPHNQLKPKRETHLSASCATVDIIGETLLEINMNGIQTRVVADVAVNLITDLILGNDWIQSNDVYILTPERRIMMRQRGKQASAPFIKPPLLNVPVTLINRITIPSFTEKTVEVEVQPGNMNEVLFEPNPRLRHKALFIASALISMRNNRMKVHIINATNRQQTLSEGTTIGTVTNLSNSIAVIAERTLSEKHGTRESMHAQLIPQGKVAKARCDQRQRDNQQVKAEVERYQCRECHRPFGTRNELFKHLRDRCYPDEIRKQIGKLTEHLSDHNQKKQIETILWKYGRLFDIREPSKIDIVLRNAVDTGAHRPVHTAPYRKSNKDEERLREETQKLLDKDIIEQSTSPWSSPVVLVKKKDGSTRFCVDYRRLNQITTRDAFPLPRIDDIYDQLTKAAYFTKLDFKAGYFQVPLDPIDRPKTAFSTRDGHFQFKVLPQGLTNGPPTFQRIVNQILGPNRWKHMLAYIDDIIIYSENFVEHVRHIEEVC
jgi:predicted aspartyl protease